MNESPLFFTEPQSGFRRSYFEFSLDVGIAPETAWFDALAGSDAVAPSAGQEKIADGFCDDRSSGVADAPGCYRVFAGVVAALVSGGKWELNAKAGGGSGEADELLVKRPSPLVPRDPPRGRVKDWGGVSTQERVIGGNHLRSLILESPAKLGIRTSGTAGRPKLIWHSMQSLARAVKVGQQHANVVWGFAYEPTHFAGLQVFLQALANRNTIVWLFDLEPNVARNAIREHGVTHLSATPTFFKMLCAGAVPMLDVRSVTLGGEAFDPAAAAAVRRAFPNAKIRNVYASTEVGSLLQTDGDVFSVPERLRDQIRVDNGELYVARELLAESIDRTEALFVATGDQVELVSESPLSFRFVGRRSDWINVGGTKVNPHTIEGAIAWIPAVQAVRVYGQPNSVVGNLVACEVVLVEGKSVTENDLKSQLSDKLSRYEMPQIVRFVTELTVTRTGKKQR